jgi:uncharacterized protein (DUF488 family)
MFYRRKVILAMLQHFDGELEKIRLQKLLFLFTQRQKKSKAYDFVPYKYGCYSFSANADLTAMVRRDFLSETETTFCKEDPTDYTPQLNTEDAAILEDTLAMYGGMSANALMKHTYINFPYWSTNSTVAREILNDAQYQKVKDCVNVDKEHVLFTIGYEGISLEEYMNRLLKNGVSMLVDVRNNAQSMKYGFSKSTLKKVCEGVGITYTHLPEVGIVSDKRKELKTQADYDSLFAEYSEDNLTKTEETQSEIATLLSQNKRIALTCFEANICQCHRKPLAEAITKLPNFKGNLTHL